MDNKKKVTCQFIIDIKNETLPFSHIVNGLFDIGCVKVLLPDDSFAELAHGAHLLVLLGEQVLEGLVFLYQTLYLVHGRPQVTARQVRLQGNKGTQLM